MTTLLIQDLARTTELDAQAMAAVHGGSGKGMYGKPMYQDYGYWSPQSVQNDFKFDASQTLLQDQSTVVNNGNNVAFASGITANVHPTQKGTNTINFG